MGMVIEKQVYLTSDLLEAISKGTGIFWSDTLGMEPYVHEAVRFWLNPPAQAQAQPAMAGPSGYQWKQLFLPAGTRLRASFGRAAYFASVEGDQIIHEGCAMSPSYFANLHGSGNRNAWRAVWLNFPGSAQWLLADTCRLLQIAAAQRLFEPDQPAAATGEPSVQTQPPVARREPRNRKPLEPKPLEPQPLDPRPLDPRPLDPRPLDPRPLEPQPLDRKPLNREPLNRKPRNRERLNRKPTPAPIPQTSVSAPASRLPVTPAQAPATAGAVASDVRAPKARAPAGDGPPGKGIRSRSRRRRRAKKQARKSAGVTMDGPATDPSASAS